MNEPDQNNLHNNSIPLETVTLQDSLVAAIKARHPDLTEEEIREHLEAMGG